MKTKTYSVQGASGKAGISLDGLSKIEAYRAVSTWLAANPPTSFAPVVRAQIVRSDGKVNKVYTPASSSSGPIWS